MNKTVHCVLLGIESGRLESPPYPGELGQRIYNNVSAKAWKQWLERLVTIINEEGLNSADPGCQDRIEKHLVGFLFHEGDLGKVPTGFHRG